MRKIPSLTVDDEKVYDDIVAAKRPLRRKHLQAVRTAVFAAYEGYRNAVPEVGKLPKVPLTDPQREALIHAFAVETAPMEKLRGNLLKRVVAVRCPFCGLSESSTLDHYLPKELHPQFAVLPKNLVPCCSPCNTQKRDKVLDSKTNVRLFLHPYYDDIPLDLFLRARVNLVDKAMILKFELVKPGGMSDTTFKRLKSHFELLDLADRYRLMALEHIRGQYRALIRAYGPMKDAKRVSESLVQGAADYEELYGNNYWLAVIYRALAANNDFCNGGFEVLKKIQ